MRGEQKRWSEGDEARRVSVQRERDSCWGLWSTAGEGAIDRKERDGRGDLAPAETMEGSYSTSLKRRGSRAVEKEAMNLI